MTRLEREIREQGEALRRRLASPSEPDAAAALLAGVDQLVIAARGTSDNAARYAQYLLGAEARLPVGLATPSLYADPRRAPRLTGAAAMAISQSGRSPDVVAVLAAARAQGRPTIALTNDPRSPLAAQADVVVPLLAGPETSVAATKTYTTSLLAIAQIAQALAPQRDRAEWLARLPGLVDELTDDLLATRMRFETLTSASLLTVLGRGLQYATAHETALKIRELTRMPAEAYSPPDVLHGPVAALGERGVAWLVDLGLRAADDVLGLAGALRARGLVTVAVASDPALLRISDVPFAMPEVPAWAAPLIAILPGQAAGLAIAERRGVDVDAPHGLSKITLTH